MEKSKKIFLIVAIFFCAGLAFISYDISRRTTFPGSKPQLNERLKKEYLKTDSTEVKYDSAGKSSRQKNDLTLVIGCY